MITAKLQKNRYSVPSDEALIILFCLCNVHSPQTRGKYSGGGKNLNQKKLMLLIKGLDGFSKETFVKMHFRDFI